MKIHESLALLKPHQKRVVAEKIELDDRLDKLRLFIQSPYFANVSASEQERLKEQIKVMNEYSFILAERIVNWNAT